MGQGPSRSSPSASDVEELRGHFCQLSQLIGKRLPLITLCRNGAATLLIAATAFMLSAVTTLFPQGSRVSAALVTLAFIQHLTSFILRERIIVQRVNGLFHTFYKVVPKYTDTSRVPKPRGDGLCSAILLAEVFSLVVGFWFVGDKFQWYLLAASFVLLISAAALTWKIVKNGSDYSTFVGTCQQCANILEKLLNTVEDASKVHLGETVTVEHC